jgi:hypothetical protein
LLLNFMPAIVDACECSIMISGPEGGVRLMVMEWYTGGACCSPSSGYASVTYYSGRGSVETYTTIASAQSMCC